MFNKNPFFHFIIPGIMSLSFTITGCAEKRVTWGDPQTGLIFRYNIQKGQTLDYRRSKEQIQSVEAMGQSITIKTDADYSIKGAGNDEKNNILARIIIDSLSIQAITPQGSRSPDTSRLAGKSFGVTYTPKGKESAFTGIDALPRISAGQPNAPAQSIKEYFLNLLPQLPDDKLKIGNSWTTPIDERKKQGQVDLTIKGETINVLEELETVKGIECVRIISHIKNTVKGSGKTEGNEITVNGDIKGTSTWYFAYKKGIFVRSMEEEDAVLKIKLGSMGEMLQSTKSKTTVELVR